MDIIDSIDRATGRQYCGGVLGDSPSDDFCGPDCQDLWHASRAQPLDTYGEPWGLSQPETSPRFAGARVFVPDIRADNGWREIGQRPGSERAAALLRLEWRAIAEIEARCTSTLEAMRSSIFISGA